MSIAAASAVVVMAALAASALHATPRRMGVLAWLLGAVALGPVVYAPYAPLATLRFEAASDRTDAVALVVMGVAWVAAGVAVVAAWRARRDTVGLGVRAVVLVCGAAWIVLTAVGLRDESGPTPAVTDSPLYLAHWLTAVIAVVALTTLALTRRPLPAQGSLRA